MLADSKSVVAVTGATGFIGIQLCARLVENGWQVRALVRNSSNATELTQLGVTLIAGDLANIDALTELVDRADAVIHCAGSVRGSCQQDFDQTNVEGTARLLEAMQGTDGRCRLVMLSSITAREPELSWYAQSKFKSEQLLENSDMKNWIILRPPAVYGPGDKEMLPIFQWMARGIATVPGSPENRTSLIHVADLVSAIVGLLDADSVPASALTLADNVGGYDWFEISRLGQKVWQRRIRLFCVPKILLDTIAALNLSLARHFGYLPMLTPAKLRELRHSDWVTDNSSLQNAINWQPDIDLETGLRELQL